MTMKMEDAELYLSLKAPYTGEDVKEAWQRARTRARAEAKTRMDKRQVLSERLKNLDEAKDLCASHSTPANTPRRWWNKTSTSGKQARGAKGPRRTFAFSPRGKRKKAPIPRRPGRSFQSPHSQQGQKNRSWTVSPLSTATPPIVVNGPGAPTVILVLVLAALVGFLSYRTRHQDGQAPGEKESVIGYAVRNESGANPTQRTVRTRHIAQPTTKPTRVFTQPSVWAPVKTPAYAGVAETTLTIFSYPRSTVTLRRTDPWKCYKFHAPTHAPQPIVPGAYEMSVERGGRVVLRAPVHLYSGFFYELVIRLDTGCWKVNSRRRGCKE